MAPYRLTIWDVAYDPHPYLWSPRLVFLLIGYIYIPLAGSINCATCNTCSQSLSGCTMHMDCIRRMSSNTQSVSFLSRLQPNYRGPPSVVRTAVPVNVFHIPYLQSALLHAASSLRMTWEYVPQSHAPAMRQAILVYSFQTINESLEGPRGRGDPCDFPSSAHSTQRLMEPGHA